MRHGTDTCDAALHVSLCMTQEVWKKVMRWRYWLAPLDGRQWGVMESEVERALPGIQTLEPVGKTREEGENKGEVVSDVTLV